MHKLDLVIATFNPPPHSPKFIFVVTKIDPKNELNLDFLVHDIYTDDKHKLFEYIFTQIKHVLISL